MALYNDKMWFGNRNRMAWIDAPAINFEASRKGYFSSNQYLNGGSFIRRSATGAKSYNLSWNLKSRDTIRQISDYTDGVYGNGPLFFLDPFAMDKNVLPQYWATPSLGAYDAPLLIGKFDEDRPKKASTPLNPYNYPSEAAVWTLDGTKSYNRLWIPCPPGYSLWVGAHGTTTANAGVQVIPTTGPTTVAPGINVPLVLATSSTRVNTRVNGDNYTGALLCLKGTGTLTLYGLIAQVLPNNRTPDLGGFISGQGHSGCTVAEDPTLTNYSVGIDRAGLSMNLIETDGWR